MLGEVSVSKSFPVSIKNVHEGHTAKLLKNKKDRRFFFPWNTTFNQKVQSWKDAVTIDGPQILGFSYLIEFLMQLSKVCLLKSFPIYLGQKATYYYYVVRILKRGLFYKEWF